jgi:hypothetical protein
MRGCFRSIAQKWRQMMFRNRNGAIALALAAALALVLLFNPGGVFAQDGAASGDSSGQAGAVLDSSGNANPTTPSTADCPLHADHQANGHTGVMQMGRGMMGSGGMGHRGHMNGMGNMMGSESMHQTHMNGTHNAADCPYMDPAAHQAETTDPDE